MTGTSTHETLAERTVGEIAATLPGATAVFRCYGIDTCYGTETPLRRAAETRGLDPAALERELDRLEEATSAEPVPTETAALIEHVFERYHAAHRRELPELVRLARRVENRAAVAAMLKTIFAQENKTAAVEQWDEVADALRAKHPKIGELMDASREDVLAYMSFPKEHWPQIASTNPLERLNREIKRRADVIGIFPNDDAIVRLVGALMLEVSDEWAVSRRYMSLETLARIEQTGDVRLPAVAT